MNVLDFLGRSAMIRAPRLRAPKNRAACERGILSRLERLFAFLEGAMNVSDKDVRQLLRLVAAVSPRKILWGVGASGHIKLWYEDGRAVRDPRDGGQIELPLTPSDNHWQRNAVASLRRAGVLPPAAKRKAAVKKKRRPGDRALALLNAEGLAGPKLLAELAYMKAQTAEENIGAWAAGDLTDEEFLGNRNAA